MKFKIVSDSSADIRKMQGVEYASVPLHIIVGEKDFIDDENVDLKEMQKELHEYKGKTSTACPGPGDWLEAFGDADVIFCITLTSALSGAFASASMAGQMYEAEHPGKKVYMIDSLSTGPEMALVIEKIAELIQAGYDHEEIAQQIHTYRRHTHLYFSLASLDNFARNGRVNPILAKGVGALGIRIIGKASEQGTLEPMDKARGDKRAVKCILKHMEKAGYQGGKIRIAHNRNSQMAEDLAAALKEKYADASIIIYTTMALCSYYAEPESVLLGFESR